jgi:hypothetical protein
MNGNIYLPQKKSVTNKLNKILFMGFLVVILIFFLLFVLKSNNNKTNNTSDNNISMTPVPTVTMVASTTPVPTETPVPTVILTTPTITPVGNEVKLYFYKGPIPPAQPVDTIYALSRYTAETNLVPFAIGEYFKGPNAEEKTAGYILPFTLGGSSTCGGSTYKYSFGSSSLRIQICKDINPVAESGDGGGYAGAGLQAMSRVLKSITSSLKVNGITKVEVYDKNNTCYAPDTGLNGCN